MATSSELDELRACLQRGLENLILTNPHAGKQLPLRQQKQKPLLKYATNSNGPGVAQSAKFNNNGVGFRNEQNRVAITKNVTFDRPTTSATKNTVRRPPRPPRPPPVVITRNAELTGTITAPVSNPFLLSSTTGGRRPTGLTSLSASVSQNGERQKYTDRQRLSTLTRPKSERIVKRPTEMANNRVSHSNSQPLGMLSGQKINSTASASRNGALSANSSSTTSRASSSVGGSTSTTSGYHGSATKARKQSGESLVGAQRPEYVGEEWSDIEENEDETSEFDFGSEQLMGSHEGLDEDDGMNTLEDDVVEDDDDLMGSYSAVSSLNGSRLASAKELFPSQGSENKLKAIASQIDRATLGSRALLHELPPMGELGPAVSDLQPPLTPSLFSNVPPTVNFVTEGEKLAPLSWEHRKLLKWKMSTITPHVIKNCIAKAGFRATRRNDWLGYWGKHMKSQCFKAVREYQKVNHFPGSFQIGRKDRLWRNLSRMQLQYGKKDYDFFPQTFILPFDLRLLKRVWDEGGGKIKWILKPPASARGIGIKVIHKWNQIPRRKPVIVQRYISKPFLINESKFDLRVYVYVTCYDPLRIYIFSDGLVRFATMKYSSSMKSLSNKFMHLTNYSINKKNTEFQPNDDEDVCQGHKWSLHALWGYMKELGIDTDAVWERIEDVVIKTIICSESAVNSLVKSNVKRLYCVHELFGFDVMLDENLKPWILEVNISPSLHSNSSLDVSIKGQMIKDLLNLSGLQIPNIKDISPNLTPSANCKNSEVCMDSRLWNNTLTKDQRAKHSFYIQKSLDDQCRMTVLDNLTADDIRVLVESQDENSRRGSFLRVFPSTTSHKYQRFFEQPRYYNVLLNEWVKKYHKQESRGISLLDDYCKAGVHLSNDSEHVWTPMLNTFSRKHEADGDFSTSNGHTSATGLTKLRRKTIKPHIPIPANWANSTARLQSNSAPSIVTLRALRSEEALPR